jgi:hypothetical protein
MISTQCGDHLDYVQSQIPEAESTAFNSLLSSRGD